MQLCFSFVSLPLLLHFVRHDSVSFFVSPSSHRYDRVSLLFLSPRPLVQHDFISFYFFFLTISTGAILFLFCFSPSPSRLSRFCFFFCHLPHLLAGATLFYPPPISFVALLSPSSFSLYCPILFFFLFIPFKFPLFPLLSKLDFFFAILSPSSLNIPTLPFSSSPTYLIHLFFSTSHSRWRQFFLPFQPFDPTTFQTILFFTPLFSIPNLFLFSPLHPVISHHSLLYSLHPILFCAS